MATVDARNAVQSLLRSPARLVSATESTLLDAYEIGAEQNHDAYDSCLLALARSHDADYLVMTDTDFEKLCADEAVSYVNLARATKHNRLSDIDG